MGGCIRDTVEVDRGLGSRAERVRCFGLGFVRNIFCPEVRTIEACDSIGRRILET